MPLHSALGLTAIAVDGNGNIYLTGSSRDELPAMNREMPKRGGSTRENAFVTKFDPLGRPLWSSYIGGTTGRSGTILDPGGDYAFDIAVDAAGQAVIVGRTTSTDFPVVNAFQGVSQTTQPQYSDGFVAKLSGDGKRLIYSSYFGGRNGDSRVAGVAAGPAGEVWIAGSSNSNQIATQYDISDPDSNHAVVIKLNPAGGVVWSTRMSGTMVYDLAVDGLGQPHIAASCWAPQDVDSCNPFVAKLSTSGSQQLYRERVSSGSNVPFALSLGLNGQAVVAGRLGGTQPADPWPAEWNLSGSGFVRILDPSGKTLSFNSVNVADQQDSVHASMGNRLIVAFATTSRDLPTERALVPRHVDGPMYVSDDRAASWTNIGGPGVATSLQLDQQSDELYLVSRSGSDYRSADGGRTWLQESVGSNLAIDPRHPEIQWSAGGTSVFRRVNKGSWNSLDFARLVPRGYSPTIETVSVSPHDGSAWVGGEFGVAVFTDEGRAYRFDHGLPVNRSFNGTTYLSQPFRFAFDPLDPNIVYAGLREGLFAKFGPQAEWVPLTRELGVYTGLASSTTITALAVAPNDPRILFIGRSDGLFRSVDRGSTWETVLRGTGVSTILPDAIVPGVFYASADVLYRSTDYGRTWQSASRGYESRGAPGGLAMSARTARLYASSLSFEPLPFVMSITGMATTYTRTWATYLENGGRVVDVVTAPTGAAVLALVASTGNDRREVTIVQIGQ